MAAPSEIGLAAWLETECVNIEGMSDLPRQQAFTRHQVLDGMLESICTYCLRTVGRSRNESDLDEFEAHHNCRERTAPLETEGTGSEA